jgi:hypothetical protein
MKNIFYVLLLSGFAINAFAGEAKEGPGVSGGDAPNRCKPFHFESTYSCHLGMEHYGSRVIKQREVYFTFLYEADVTLKNDQNFYDFLDISPSQWHLTKTDSLNGIKPEDVGTDLSSITLWLNGGSTSNDYELSISKDFEGKSLFAGSGQFCRLTQDFNSCQGELRNSEQLDVSLSLQNRIKDRTGLAPRIYDRVNIYARCKRVVLDQVQNGPCNSHRD